MSDRRRLSTLSAHVVSFWRRPVEGSLVATCSCGWRGRRRMTHEVAMRDYSEHVQAVKGEATHA